MNKKFHKWTDDERDIVRRDYDGHNESAHRIADKLTYMTGDKITINAVKAQCAKMGLLTNKSRRWTNKEIETLSEMVTVYSPQVMARKLHRSVNAVCNMAKRQGFSRCARDGWYDKKEVCEIMGVDHKKIQGYMDRGELKASYHTEIKPKQNGGACWHIKQADLIDFIKKNAGDFMGRNVDLVTITWLLTGDL